jgi:hypothetical protein
LQAEAQFAIREITQPLDKYYLVMSALSETQVDMVSSVLREEPDQESYGQLKAALVASHTMSDYQKVDKLMAMERLGGCKLTELLAAMQKLQPPRDEAFFAWAFMQRLPREVRVLLAQDDTHMRRLAEKADTLMALHQPLTTSAVLLRAIFFLWVGVASQLVFASQSTICHPRDHAAFGQILFGDVRPLGDPGGHGQQRVEGGA